jgi:hypothetical protein
MVASFSKGWHSNAVMRRGCMDAGDAATSVADAARIVLL